MSSEISNVTDFTDMSVAVVLFSSSERISAFQYLLKGEDLFFLLVSRLFGLRLLKAQSSTLVALTKNGPVPMYVD